VTDALITSDGRGAKPGVVRWSRARRTAIVVVDGALAVSAGAVAGLWGATPSGAANGTAPAPGWNGAQAPLPSGPDAPNSNPRVNFGGGGGPFPPNPDQVSCASAVSCVAVGTYESGGSATAHGLIETYSHGSWSALEAPLPAGAPAGAASSLVADSCATDGSCVAVGDYKGGTNQPVTFIDTLTGGNWTSMAAPLPADITSGASFFKSVDCVSGSSCVAVGTADGGPGGAGGAVGFADVLSGGTWSGQDLPAPAGAATYNIVFPESVSCPSVGACAVSGVYEIGSGSQFRSYLLTQSAGGWTAIDAPQPSDAATGTGENSFLPQVSCSAIGCEAVGDYKNGSGNPEPLIDRLTGGTWGAVPAPLPANAGTGSNSFALLSSVSCAFDGCDAVGSYEDSATGRRPLVETTGATGATTGSEASQPADAATGSGVNGNLQGVSCLSLNECTAVGYYANGSGRTTSLIDSGTAGALADVAAPAPGSAATGSNAASSLAAVSCAARGSCLAGGSFNDTSANQQGLLESYAPPEGYWTNASDGGVFTYGNAQFHGSAGNLVLNKPVVGMAATPGDGGYWEVATDGGIFSYGDAQFYGSTGAIKLNQPVVGMAATPDGAGYWLVASDGGIFSYGDAQFYGSTGAMKLNKPVVGMASTPDGKGYWLVASDGGIFSYGDAQFYGSTGAIKLNQPVVGMASTPTGQGYWLVASDGGIFSYGDAQFYGSTGAIKLNKPIVSMMSSFDGAGYWLVASDGGIFNYGDAGFYGSAGSLKLNKPVVNGAAT
jgi:hypothetical protein